MSRPARHDAGVSNSVSFPIRFNNSNDEPSVQEYPSPRAEKFVSLADLRASLPASCDLVEYVRGTPQHFSISYVPRALPPSTPALGPSPTWFPPYAPSGTPRSQQLIPAPPPHDLQILPPLYTLTASAEAPLRSQQLIPAPPPHDFQTLPPLYTLTASAEAPHLRVTMQPPVSATGPNNAILHPLPFPSAPINSGAFTNGHIPSSASSSGGSSPDVDMVDQLHENLAELSLYPTAQSLNHELGQMCLDTPSEQAGATVPVCTNQDCPVPEPHAEGVYRFNGETYQLRDWCANGIARRVFGDSNPPPSLWRALDALAQGAGTWEDARAVGGFQAAHYVG